MNFVQEAMADADAILMVTDLFEKEFVNTEVGGGNLSNVSCWSSILQMKHGTANVTCRMTHQCCVNYTATYAYANTFACGGAQRNAVSQNAGDGAA